MSEFRDVYGKITDRIIADLEQGVPMPAQYSAKAEPPALPPAARIDRATGSLPRPARKSGMAEPAPITPKARITCRCRPSRPSAPESFAATEALELIYWTKHGKRLARDMAASAGAMKATPRKNVVEIGSAFLCVDLEINRIRDRDF